MQHDRVLRSQIGVEGGGEFQPVQKVNPNTATRVEPASKIRSLGHEKRHEDNWNRTPNSPGTGAIHVRTFHCKLTDEGLEYLDRHVNEWLDEHPQYEVKFVTANIGEWTGKLGKEPHMVVQVWV